MLNIKRYPNRKLYDTEAKQYITLDEITDLIRQGNEIHVTDNVTGEDLTAVTLSQIILEQEKKQSGFLPRSVLTGLIQTGGDRINTLQRNIMSSLGFLHQVDEEIKYRIETLIKRGELAEREGKQLLDKLLSLGTPAIHNQNFPSEEMIEQVLAKQNIPSRNDMDRIVEQLDELATKLDEFIQQNE
jgi:polyhydroxyalkanoate synthesis repressor PhaR